ncbi:hypothetical protein C5L14_17605 [Labrys okinawensis]|uniref:Uncharacterized protein n=1 Tax=Labrys okinawensis TaxID=346911 RepID=A0A2S9Q9P6_9HYPH|nr:hypothetical protein [Labrys okinawensis]PRH86071.1 hypothetical protein C5L14_17605 [Labrys okinawensis]
MRRSFIAGLLGIFGLNKIASAKDQKTFPPVPKWRPSFLQPMEKIIDRMTYYTNGKSDIAVFRSGTCVILGSGLSDSDAKTFALKTLSDIFNYHPDMNPKPMDDGNILVTYNHPAANVVLHDVAEAHWDEVEKHYLDGLATSEVLVTPLGPNKFDAFGKQALLGRAYMFMDAQAPEIVQVRRNS